MKTPLTTRAAAAGAAPAPRLARADVAASLASTGEHKFRGHSDAERAQRGEQLVRCRRWPGQGPQAARPRGRLGRRDQEVGPGRHPQGARRAHPEQVAVHPPTPPRRAP